MPQREMENDIGRSVVLKIFRYADFEAGLPRKCHGSPERQQGRVVAERPEIAVFIKGGVAVELGFDGKPGERTPPRADIPKPDHGPLLVRQEVPFGQAQYTCPPKNGDLTVPGPEIFTSRNPQSQIRTAASQKTLAGGKLQAGP